MGSTYGIAETDRTLDDRLPVEQLARPDDREHTGDRALVLGRDRLEDAVALGAGLDELEVALGDVEGLDFASVISRFATSERKNGKAR